MSTPLRTTESHRLSFWHHFFGQVNDLRYAYLKYFYQPGEWLPAGTDIDLVIDESELSTWLKRLRQVPEVWSLQQRQTGHACYVKLFFADGSFLELDLIYRIQRKGICFLRTEDVLSSARSNGRGVKVPALIHDFSYLSLFYLLNGVAIPASYRRHFEQLNRLDQLAVQEYLEDQYGWDLSGPQEIWTTSPDDVISMVEPTLRSWPENQGWVAWKRIWRSRFDGLHHRAPVITFSGVDGAGKTTTMDAFQQTLEQKYRFRVKRLRQRPGLLPILSTLRHGRKAAEQKAADTLPRQGTNQSRLSSLIRFAWYYLDYQLGQWWVYWRYTRRGVVVLYDRYYFDYIADSRRANIALSGSWIAGLYHWVFKPDLNIMLYADPEVILARKQELDGPTIIELTGRYRAAFADLETRYPAQRYTCINNIDLPQTLRRIEQLWVQHLTR